MSIATLKLNGFSFAELFTQPGLVQLDRAFLDTLKRKDESLCHTLLAYRSKSQSFNPLQISELIIKVGSILEEFIIELFKIEDAAAALKLISQAHKPIFTFKEWYVLRQAKRRLTKKEALPEFAELDAWLTTQLKPNRDRELAVAKLGRHYLTDQTAYAQDIEKLIQWCVQALRTPEGQAAVAGWQSFKLPQRLDYEHLVPLVSVNNDSLGRWEGLARDFRERDGFHLTDDRMSQREVYNEIHYCVYCHKNEGDYCSKGFALKKKDQKQGLKVNPLGDTLTGCPLEEKISEMNVLKKEGWGIAALATVMIDNPMCPATGHRVCNDCMKACIYQKQEPVNIPQIETRVLTDILSLPWGVEIYDLLTRWNPLRQEQFLPTPYNGLKVLVVGLGPAGFTLAYHLLQAGFAVVGVDGLKIEPLPKAYFTQPIYRYEDIKENLAERVMTGFGGVAEYGITVRWDKNFLKLIYITLCRREYFQVFGDVRFGGTLTVEDAWALGFDHLSVAVGAGLPRELPIPGSLAPGMRQANDFLMALQLTGAAKQSSLVNLQIRLPAVVIGGGLTGIDTATEVQAYYIKQVEKILTRYEKLTAVLGEARVREQFDDASFEILREFLSHGKAVRAERALAGIEKRVPNFIGLIRQWGGVSIVYRRRIQESPAYRRNHEEVIKALEEGIYYVEGLEPSAVRLDQYGHVEKLVCRSRICDEQGQWVLSDEEKLIPARSIFVATGSKPNVAYEFEHRGTFVRTGMDYQTYQHKNDKLQPVEKLHQHCKTEQLGAFTSYNKLDKRVTFVGDVHPVFHGNVVKAIASGKRTYPHIVKLFGQRAFEKGDSNEYREFAERMDNLFSAKVISVKRQAPSIVELTVRAPMVVKNFLPGHFYRIQNFESNATFIGGTKLQTESLALLGAEVDKKAGTIQFMVLEQGASSRLVATFKPGDPISVMGPTGVRTKIPEDSEMVMVIGDHLSLAQVRVVGKAMREAGNYVLFIAFLQSADELYCQQALERVTDTIVWVTQTGSLVKPNRPQDCVVSGDLVEAMIEYADSRLSPNPEGPDIRLQDVDRVLLVGSPQMIKTVHKARHTILKKYLAKDPKFVASIYGPMQCMLKGICAQCLQWQLDPETGERTKAVFACSWQDQPLDIVDLNNLDERLVQNRTQEILTNLWLDYLLMQHTLPRV